MLTGRQMLIEITRIICKGNECLISFDLWRYNMDNICDYDEGYDRDDVYEIGWCYKCQCNPECPYKKRTMEERK